MSGKNGVTTKSRSNTTRTKSFKSNGAHSKQLLRTEKNDKRSRRQSQISMASSEDAESDADSDDHDQDMRDYGNVLEDEKDEAELELEKLVFGDSKGFMDNVQAFGKQQQADTLMRDDGAEVSDEEGEGMDGMRDQDLFFMDTTGSGVPQSGAVQALDSDDESSQEDIPGLARQKAAWQDSDDERISVSLVAVPRLRKLRLNEDEDVVNGKEYIKRLRRQFLLLNPTPDWAIEARQQPPAKKRRLSRDSNDSEADNSSDEDLDGNNLATKPLAELLRNASALVRSGTSTKTRKLRPETIDIQRIKDIGVTQPSAIDSISFHPTLPLLLTSGPSGTLYLHHIIPSPPAEEANPLLTSLHLRKTPLTTTAFHPKDGRIFLSARRRFFHVWDVATGKVEKVTSVYGQAREQRSMEVLKPSPCGRWIALKGSSRKDGGLVNILSASTLQWHSQLRIDSRHGVADFAWWRTGDGLTVAGKNGEITEWSLLSESVIGRWTDAGAVGTNVIALGGKLGLEGDRAAPIGNDRWVAVGSSSGITNIYDRGVWYRDWEAAGKKTRSPCPAGPAPTRVLDQLVTPITSLAFSPDAQVLAVASRLKRDAFRLVHLPTCTVYKNWPTAATPLGRVTGMAFGRAGGEEAGLMLAVGNEAGHVRMWEIRS